MQRTGPQWHATAEVAPGWLGSLTGQEASPVGAGFSVRKIVEAGILGQFVVSSLQQEFIKQRGVMGQVALQPPGHPPLLSLARHVSARFVAAAAVREQRMIGLCRAQWWARRE